MVFFFFFFFFNNSVAASLLTLDGYESEILFILFYIYLYFVIKFRHYFDTILNAL